MAKVFLHSVSLDDSRIPKWMQGAFQILTESAGRDPFGVHSLTRNPEEADFIVFTELGSQGIFAERVRHHPYVKKYREKCFLFDPGDYALPFLPGVYASLRKRYYDPARTRTGYYLRIDENPYVDFRPAQETYRYAATFIGSIDNHPVRARLTSLPSQQFLIEDTSSFALKMLYGGEKEERHRFWSHYAQIIASAPFALCPRGRGPGSVRLFEVMQMGRVPVIIADDWIYPARVAWQASSITVPESQVERIPEILERYRDSAAAMGRRARLEWEKYYAPAVRFHWLAEDCLEMLHSRRRRESIAGRLVWRHLLNYRTFRLFLVSKKATYRETGKIIL
jgi:Exostosin family